MQKKKKAIYKRKFTRFKPDSGDFALVDYKTEGVFSPTQVCLITTESYGGCGVVSVSPHGFKRGDVVRIKLGKMKSITAITRWVRELGENVFHIGLEFKEN